MKIDTGIAIRDLRQVPALARAAEAMGFDGIWSSETSHDPFLVSALVAEHTQRVSLGTAIAVAFPRSPGTLAYSAWDLATLSNGRFILGLGAQVKAQVVSSDKLRIEAGHEPDLAWQAVIAHQGSKHSRGAAGKDRR